MEVNFYLHRFCLPIGLDFDKVVAQIVNIFRVNLAFDAQLTVVIEHDQHHFIKRLGFVSVKFIDGPDRDFECFSVAVIADKRDGFAIYLRS